MSRLDNSIKNIKYAVGGQALGLIINFLVRMVFVRTLNSEYLGINGLFSSILTMLSLAEMGISTAVIYSLYRPIAENDINKIVALMQLYKRMYITVGLIIGITGISITPLLEYFISDIPNIPYLRVIYLIYVANSSISYFWSYKRSIIIANQKNYIATAYHYALNLIMGVTQIVILLVTGDFILYFICQVAFTWIENVIISHKADNLYPYIRNNIKWKLDKKTSDEIIRNIKAMFLHRIGSIVVNGTDNLIISKFVSTIAVGFYSNYLMITTALNTVFALLFQSVTASIGNLGVTETNEKKNEVFKVLNFVGFWFYSFASISLFILLNPFIVLWVGNSYVFPLETVFVIVANFYITGLRKAGLTFRDALGLYWHDRYKPLVEALLNLSISLVLAIRLGITGVLLGTTISMLLTSSWIEPFVLYKYGLNKPVKDFFIIQIKYTLTTLIVAGITVFLSELLPYAGIVSFTIKMIICCIVPNVIYFLIFRNSFEMKYGLKLINNRLKKRIVLNLNQK